MEAEKEVPPGSKGMINEIKSKHEVNEPEGFSIRFQLLATGLIICCALAGAMLGVILSKNEASEDLVSWLALPGDLFIRALKCAVLPLVFVNVIIAVMQMIDAGKAGAVGKYTILVYLLTTFIASIEGLIAVVLFQSRFEADLEPEDPTFVRILCPHADSMLVQQSSELQCVPSASIASNFTGANFVIGGNVGGFFQTAESEFETLTFSETLQDGIFKKLVPENIVNEFATGGFVGVVMFGIIFGAASSHLVNKPTILIQFMEDVNDCLVTIIQGVIYLTPIAVFSLIVGALASQEDLGQTFANIGVLLLAALSAISAHLLIVYPAMFYLFTKENPYSYMKHVIPAQIFAFSCASSAATLPVTMRCVKQTGKVPDSIRDFVLPIGATVNMDGTALYFPPALIFLSKTLGLSSGPAEFFLIVLVSTIGSAGAAPVPNAGLVLIITAYNTVYGGTGAPSNFGIIVGIDWLMDRFQTALNITGDAMVSRIVTKLAKADLNEGEPTSQLHFD